MSLPTANGSQPGVPSLPANFLESLRAGIAQSRAQAPAGGYGGKPLLRLLKSGSWVYGVENIEVEEGSHWVVNPVSLQHGYCCWVNSELRGEVMTPVTQDMPAMPGPINGNEFQPQRSCDLKCISGEDTGVEVHYKTNSKGGLRAADDMLLKIWQRIATEGVYICPVLQFGVSDYNHPSYGQIFTPVLQIVAWSDINGQVEARSALGAAGVAPPQDVFKEPVPQPAPTPPAAAAPAPLPQQVGQPVRRRGASAAAPAAPVAPQAPQPAPQAPQATAQAHVGQRRRPGRPAAPR